MVAVPMTKKGEAQLREELSQLINVERPRLSKAIGEAREHGDLKENAEYHAAKEQQGLTEAKIAFIQSRLKDAHVVDVSKIKPTEKVMFGATIKLLNCDSEEELGFQIVGEEESDFKKQKCSISSPIAKACVGRTLGDVIEVKTPNGDIEYEIIAVDYI